MKYKAIWVRVENKDGSITMHTLFDKTIDEAMDIAKKFGYKEPKWYQFWLKSAIIYKQEY